MFFSIKKKTTFIFIAFVFFLILDRFLKFLVLNVLSYPIELIKNLLKINLVKNYNIAFSLPFGGDFLIILITFILILLLIAWINLFKNKNFSALAYLTLIILGAISNLFDRVTLGYVVDYIDLAYFTVFNLADAMIFFGVLGLFFKFK